MVKYVCTVTTKVHFKDVKSATYVRFSYFFLTDNFSHEIIFKIEFLSKNK